MSRRASSISEPAFLLTMFHPMFPGEHGVEHYSRRPRETTRMQQDGRQNINSINRVTNNQLSLIFQTICTLVPEVYFY